MSNDVATLNASDIGDVFQNVVTRLEAEMSLVAQSPTIAIDVVDVELNFKSVALNGNGGLLKFLVSDKETNSSLEIKLATRLRAK